MISITSIDQTEALRYLGYGENTPDEKIQEIINDCEQELLKVIAPRFLYRRFDIMREDKNIFLDNCKLKLTGTDINSHLTDCNSLVLMCVTLSVGADKLIRINQINDMTRAVILDSLASAAVEQVCNKVEEEIRNEFPNLYQTWRYSPGYGDLTIDIQHDFLNVLNAQKKIGLCVNESNILIPRKSVTAIIGLSEHEITQKKRGCQSCNLRETCTFRRRGEHCEF